MNKIIDGRPFIEEKEKEKAPTNYKMVMKEFLGAYSEYFPQAELMSSMFEDFLDPNRDDSTTMMDMDRDVNSYEEDLI